MEKPTTGPYAVNDYREIVSPGGESVIASVLDADVYAGTMAESPEADANARLLAASWELREVCRMTLAVLESMPEPVLGGWDWPVLAEMTRAALAKADGEDVAR